MGERALLGGASAARTGGLLLAGGQSKRFGAEKAVARFRGRTMMDCITDGFADFPHFAVSARPHAAAAERARARGADILYDNPDAPSGPLAGILEGLIWSHDHGLDFLATTPCDAPLLPRDLFARLSEAIGAAPAAYAVTMQGQHPLCAIWRVTLRTPLQETLAGGVHPSVRAFLAAHGAVSVYFDDAHAFANANTADALAALERKAC